MSLRDGMVYIWQHRTVHNMSDNIEPPKPMKLYFPDLLGETTPSLALTSDGDSVNLYLLSGNWLLLRKLTTRDFNNNISSSRQSTSILMRAHTAKLRIVLERNGNSTMDEKVVSLTAAPSGIFSSPLVILGTSKGKLYWVSHTAVPVGMQLQKIVAPASSGILNRLFSAIHCISINEGAYNGS